MTNQEIKRELDEILPEIKTLVLNAQELLRETSEAQRAESNWIAHILTALDKEHDYLGSSMITMQDSIDSL